MGIKSKFASKQKIEEYINFYNNFRLQSKLKGMDPLEYRHHSFCNYIYFCLFT